jgi:enoyl-CoA hydratase/carnithine racemase
VGSLRQVDIEPRIALLRLGGPARRSALDSGLLLELVDALERLSIDDGRRVLVFSTTSTAALCSGVDVTEELGTGGAARMKSFSQLVAALEAFPVPQGPRPD